MYNMHRGNVLLITNAVCVEPEREKAEFTKMFHSLKQHESRREVFKKHFM